MFLLLSNFFNGMIMDNYPTLDWSVLTFILNSMLPTE